MTAVQLLVTGKNGLVEVVFDVTDRVYILYTKYIYRRHEYRAHA